jgi:hypothetical protein
MIKRDLKIVQLVECAENELNKSFYKTDEVLLISQEIKKTIGEKHNDFICKHW